MPLVTMTLRKGRDATALDAMLDSVHAALVGSGAPPADRFQRVIELDSRSFRYDTRYPDLTKPRDESFVLIEILWSVGRSVKVKKPLVANVAGGVAAAAGIDIEHVMVVFIETAWENWAFASGTLLHAS